MSSIDRRIGAILSELTRRDDRQCQTCWGGRYAIVAVPDAIAADRPEFKPTHCQECGKPLRRLHQVIGVESEALARLFEPASA